MATCCIPYAICPSVLKLPLATSAPSGNPAVQKTIVKIALNKERGWVERGGVGKSIESCSNPNLLAASEKNLLRRLLTWGRGEKGKKKYKHAFLRAKRLWMHPFGKAYWPERRHAAKQRDTTMKVSPLLLKKGCTSDRLFPRWPKSSSPPHQTSSSHRVHRGGDKREKPHLPPKKQDAARKGGGGREREG